MKKLAVYPGSFDPITNGHLDIIERAAALFDEVIVAILNNNAKKSLFTVAERKAQIAQLIKRFKNVKVYGDLKLGRAYNKTETFNNNFQHFF